MKQIIERMIEALRKAGYEAADKLPELAKTAIDAALAALALWLLGWFNEPDLDVVGAGADALRPIASIGDAPIVLADGTTTGTAGVVCFFVAALLRNFGPVLWRAIWASKSTAIVLTLALLGGCPSFAQDVKKADAYKPGIEGATNVALGQPIKLKAIGGDESTFLWEFSPQPNYVDVADHGLSVLAFTIAPGQFWVQLTEIGPSGDEARPFRLAKNHVLVVVGDAPPNPSPPGPGPQPTPPGPGPAPNPNPPGPPSFPDGEFGAAEKSYEWAMAHVEASERSKAKALAERLDGLSAAIRAGTITSLQKIINTAAEHMDATVGPKDGPWGAWREKIGGFIKDLYAARKFTETGDVATFIDEVVLGLKAVT